MKIICITDRQHSKRPFKEQIEEICKGAPDMVVLREKDLQEPEYRDLALSIKSICDAYRVEFCIHTFADVADELQAHLWVPFGEFMDLDSYRVPSVMVSVHSIGEAIEAQSKGAESLVFGNVFETTCKPGLPAKGLDALKAIVGSALVPVYGIGGIDSTNAGQVIDTGAAGVCMMSGLMASDDPKKEIEDCRKACP